MTLGELNEFHRKLVQEKKNNISYASFHPDREAENTQLTRAIDALGEVVVLRAEEARDEHAA